jgi:hypothetical protein
MSEREDYIETYDDTASEEPETCVECGCELHAMDFDVCEDCIEEMEDDEFDALEVTEDGE